MSELGGILTAALADVAAAVTGVTTHQGLLALDDIPSDQFPFAMAYEPVETPTEIEWGQDELEIEFAIAIVRNGDTQEQSLQDLDDVRDGIRAEDTLGGLVRRARVTQRALDESTDASRKIAVMAVTAQKVI